MTELRRTNFDLMRELCIKENWCTHMSNDMYSYMLSRCENVDNLTTDKLYELAQVIFDHSNHDDDYSYEEQIRNIMYLIVVRATYPVFSLEG